MTWKLDSSQIIPPKDFLASAVAAGVKKEDGRLDVGLLYSVRPAIAAVRFTTNVVKAVSVAKDERMPGAAANSAVALIRVVGPPQCLPPLVTMIAHPHPDPRFRYFGPDAALKCGGVKGIKDVVKAMPDQAYEKEKLLGTVVLDITKMTPRDQVQAELRDLLNDNSRMARWVAVETLAAMKSVEDAPKIAAVKGGGDKLIGFWGDGAAKPDPTLGQRAKELAAGLK